jgi:glycine cleavage system H protein
MADDEVPKDLKYTKEHEWVRIEGKIATIGITRFAVEQLGDITQVDLPKEGETVRKNDVLGTVESVKAVSDVYAPLSGKVLKVNSPLGDTPEYLSDDPYDEGWMVQIEVSSEAELAELLDAKAYTDFVADQDDH